jgi:hypothetical protein
VDRRLKAAGAQALEAAGAQSLETAAAQAGLVLQIHDELVLESPPSEVEQVTRIVVEEMMSAMSLDVPLDVTVHEGATWAECDKARPAAPAPGHTASDGSHP